MSELLAETWSNGALAALAKYRALPPSARSAEMLLQVVDQLLWTGKHAEALELPAALQDEAPDLTRVRFELGRAHLQRGELDAARRAFASGMGLVRRDSTLDGEQRERLERRLQNRVRFLDHRDHLLNMTGAYKTDGGRLALVPNWTPTYTGLAVLAALNKRHDFAAPGRFMPMLLVPLVPGLPEASTRAALCASYLLTSENCPPHARYDMRHTIPLCLLFSAVMVNQVGAQSARAAREIVLRADGWLDVEASRVVTGQEIHIRDRRIVAVGANLDIPEDADVIELPGRTIMPGLIDLHTHLFYAEDPGLDLTAQALVTHGSTSEYERMLQGVARAREYLCAGFTSVRDLGNSGRYMDVALRNGVGRLVEGPGVYPSGPGVATYGAQFANLTEASQAFAAAEYDIVSGPVEAVEAVRRHVHHGSMVLKVYANNSPNPRAGLNTAELAAAVEAAQASYLPVTAHATFDGAVRRALDAGILMIEHGYGASDSTLAMMARLGAVLIPTLQDSMTMSRAMAVSGDLDIAALRGRLDEQRDFLRLAMSAGVTIAFGSDAYLELGVARGELARRSLYAWIEAGMEPARVLRAATATAADVLRNTGIGRIRSGARADLIAVEGNPLRDLRSLERISLVMRDGRRVCTGGLGPGADGP